MLAISSILTILFQICVDGIDSSAPIDISQYICPDPTWSPTQDPTGEPTPMPTSPTAAPTKEPIQGSTLTTEPSSMNPTAAPQLTISTTSTSSVIGSKLNRVRVALTEDSNDKSIGQTFYIRTKWKDTLCVFLGNTVFSIFVA